MLKSILITDNTADQIKRNPKLASLVAVLAWYFVIGCLWHRQKPNSWMMYLQYGYIATTLVAMVYGYILAKKTPVKVCIIAVGILLLLNAVS